MSRSKINLILGVIVFAQFCGTSLWFAGNAALNFVLYLYGHDTAVAGHLASMVQFGFIVGTLVFALIGIADKFSPSKTFLFCSVAGALSNSLMLIFPGTISLGLELASRGLTGFFLAGIYPIGMKIAADYTKDGLGTWLGLLVGALVLGTSFPHALKLFPSFADADTLLAGVSLLALIGGVMLYVLVPDGPHRKEGVGFSFGALKEIFAVPHFRGPAFGYFGHMWELYAFWAFVPFIVDRYYASHESMSREILPFLVIAIGAISCIVGGMISRKKGSDWVARISLIISGLCCLMSPLIFHVNAEWLFATFMFIWGASVISDSPQFSALVANNAPPHVKGSAITLVICIGFAITIVSIQLLSYFQDSLGDYLLWILVPGPVLGVMSVIKKDTVQGKAGGA